MTDLSDPSVSSRQIRVAICDDHALFRRGLRLVLESDGGIEVVGEACDGDEAVQLVAEAVPDVVLMDVRMPGSTGIEAARVIRDTSPDCSVIMLTVSDDEADLFDAVRAGASGYLLKEVSIDEIAAAVHAVDSGQSLISPSMATPLLREFALLADKAEAKVTASTPSLTTRELEVLGLVAQSMSNRQIAAELFISENTVKNHVRNILEKLQLHSRMEAVMYAVKQKLLDIDDT